MGSAAEITVRINGSERTLGAKESIEHLLESLGRPVAGLAVAVNGEVIPRSLWAGTTLDQGDRVEILTAVAGG
ncbi:MAG: sulfur carrier protein ThiS [Actinobacteria bacterium]|nr:sulfur carrier protein ThiS [Actinomycetota bacterium]